MKKETEIAEIEKQVSRLVAQFGIAEVQRHLERILPRSDWQDWQRLENFALRAHNRFSRPGRKKRGKTGQSFYGKNRPARNRPDKPATGRRAARRSLGQTRKSRHDALKNRESVLGSPEKNQKGIR